MLPVTVIIVTHNSAAVIRESLASVYDAARVIVIDNNSTDNTCALVAEHFPRVECRISHENAGFGRANNQALAMVETPFSLLLNPDAVMNEGALARLLAAATLYPDAAILSPCLLDNKGEIQQSYKASIFDRDTGRKTTPPMAEGDVCAGFLSGAVMLIRMEYITQTGFFDPAIFLYYEDDDLCLRARHAGYGLVWVHDAVAVHLCGKSSPPTVQTLYRKNWHLIWSRLYLEKKYHGTLAACCLSLKLVLLYGSKTLCYGLLLKTEKRQRSYARLKAAFCFFFKP